jgi:hypothetical protein
MSVRNSMRSGDLRVAASFLDVTLADDLGAVKPNRVSHVTPFRFASTPPTRYDLWGSRIMAQLGKGEEPTRLPAPPSSRLGQQVPFGVSHAQRLSGADDARSHHRTGRAVTLPALHGPLGADQAPEATTGPLTLAAMHARVHDDGCLSECCRSGFRVAAALCVLCHEDKLPGSTVGVKPGA